MDFAREPFTSIVSSAGGAHLTFLQAGTPALINTRFSGVNRSPTGKTVSTVYPGGQNR
jgi:hypothetical protein